MPLTTEQLGKVISDLLGQHRKEKRRLDVIAAYMANQVCDIYVPRKASNEYRMLVDQARFNVMPLVVAVVAEDLFIDGYRPTSETGRAPSTDNAPIWDAVWQPNRMDARQAAIYRPAITYGYSYATVYPGDGSVPVLTPYSPRKLTAIYEDEVNDEWPMYAMVARRQVVQAAEPGSDPLASESVPAGVRLTVYDENFRYEVTKTEQGWSVADEAGEHGLGVVPVVRFLDEQGCDGLPLGKVEPLLPVQRQLNQTTFGLLMAQQFSAFRQRWATGMTIEEDANGNPVEPFQGGADKLLQNTSTDGKFGEFGQTDLDGYLNSRDKALLFISAIAQIPPHQLVIGTGISNISADALVALQTGHDHDIAEHKTSFGESTEQMLRLAGKAMGDGEAWEDTSAQVVWRDTTPRSLAQVADALGKLATQLGIPPEALWEKIPGVTDQDIDRWKEMRSEADVMGNLEAIVNGSPEVPGAVPAGNGANPLAPV